jgi:hypothetical protein
MNRLFLVTWGWPDLWTETLVIRALSENLAYNRARDLKPNMWIHSVEDVTNG